MKRNDKKKTKIEQPITKAPETDTAGTPSPRTVTPLLRNRFIVSIDGFKSAEFTRVGAYDTRLGTLTLTRNLTREDTELAAWYGQGGSRAVSIHMASSKNEIVRSMGLGTCHPMRYEVGPFDLSDCGAVEETITIRQDDPPTYKEPTKAEPPSAPEKN